MRCRRVPGNDLVNWILLLVDGENGEGLGGEREMDLVACDFGGGGSKDGLELVGRSERRVFDGGVEGLRLLRIVVDDEEFFSGRFAEEGVVVFVPSDVPLFARAQGRMTFAEGEKR